MESDSEFEYGDQVFPAGVTEYCVPILTEGREYTPFCIDVL